MRSSSHQVPHVAYRHGRISDPIVISIHLAQRFLNCCFQASARSLMESMLAESSMHVELMFGHTATVDMV